MHNDRTPHRFQSKTMTKSGCLALMLLLSGSIAAAAAVASPDAIMSTAHDGEAATADHQQMAMVYCQIKKWKQTICTGYGVLVDCDYTKGHDCKIAKTCHAHYPLKSC